MDYCIPFNAGRTTVPVRLAMRSGERLGSLLPGVDAASALMITEAADGTLAESFHPLRLHLHPIGSSPADSEWVLHGVRAGAEAWVYFLDLPAEITRLQAAGRPPARGLSIQIVGHSAFRSESSFAGHVALALGSAPETSLLPRFARFVEQWLPVLLPERFVAATTLAHVEEEGRQPVLVVTLARGENTSLAPALGVAWDPSGWSDAIVEPVGATDDGGHLSIRGGCFISPEGRISHWFGGRIGLDKRGFRARAAEQLLRQAPTGQASWCFWIETFEDVLVPAPAASAVRIRHPVLGLAWDKIAASPTQGVSAPAYLEAMGMLRQAARIRGLCHVEWEKLGSDFASRWWQRWEAQDVDSTPEPWLESLEEKVRAFYERNGRLLARLAAFQSSLAASPGNPLSALAEFAAAAHRGKEAAS